MFLRILKKDLKRKKTMNIILLLFIFLASMFVASGLYNVISVVSGTDYYLDLAGVPNQAIITMGDNVTGEIEKALKNDDRVEELKIEEVIFGAPKKNIFLENGKEAEAKNTLLFQSIDERKLNYFDADNNCIESVPEGHVYATGLFAGRNEIKPGEKITVRLGGLEMTLIYDGKAKDAFLGTDFMGNTRFLMNDNDYRKMLEDEVIYEHLRGEIGYVQVKDGENISSAVSEIPGVAFNGERDTLKLCYVIDMVIAFIVLVLSICLIIVSFVVLKFSINFTIAEEFREIGVMKAIGIKDRSIRRLYIGKYLMLALIGSVIGLAASVPFENLLMKSVTENMVLGNDIGFFVNIIGVCIVVVLIVAFAYHCTSKVKKSSPIDAIRSGQTGERYKKKTIYRIGKSHVGTNTYLAFNDVISSPRRFTTIVISFFVCTLFVLMLVNTTNTMESPNLVETFSSKSDLYVEDVADAMNLMNGGGKEDLVKSLADRAQQLTEEGMPAVTYVEIAYNCKVSFAGEEHIISCQQGVNTVTTDYKYLKGSAPANANEIAITPSVSKLIGAKIGDVVTIDFGEEKRDCMVTAYFQTMNQLGEVIRLHQDALCDWKNVASVFQYQIRFTDHPSAKEIEKRKERIKELWGNDKIMNQTEYCSDCIGVVDTMKSVQYLLLTITIIVVLLVTILMEKSFITDEKSQIAILKAIGFKDRDVIRWHIFRFGIVGLAAIFLAALVSIPMTNLCISPIFGMMGASDVKYRIDPLQIFVIYPGIILLTTIVFAGLTALTTKQITCRDTANIE